MFEMVCYLLSALMVIAGAAFVTGKEIAGLQPNFGANRPVPSASTQEITGAICFAMAVSFALMGLNTMEVVRWLTS